MFRRNNSCHEMLIATATLLLIHVVQADIVSSKKSAILSVSASEDVSFCWLDHWPKYEQDDLDQKLNNLEKQIKVENARMLLVKSEVHKAADKVAALSAHKAATFSLSNVEEVRGWFKFIFYLP